MEPAKTFEDLIVWQKAHEFVLSVYRVTQSFPNKELYGLTSQFRRAAVSIHANIAEGFPKSKADKLRFMTISKGSLEECRYYLKLSKVLDYLTESNVLNQITLLHQEVSKLLDGYYRGTQNAQY